MNIPQNIPISHEHPIMSRRPRQLFRKLKQPLNNFSEPREMLETSKLISFLPSLKINPTSKKLGSCEYYKPNDSLFCKFLMSTNTFILKNLDNPISNKLFGFSSLELLQRFSSYMKNKKESLVFRRIIFKTPMQQNCPKLQKIDVKQMILTK